jgi:probable LLM family oxidoreductase
MIQLGLDTFGDVTSDIEGRPIPQAQAIRDVVEEGVLAAQVGIDAFGVGEHHRPDFAVSAPEVVLAAIAAKTERIVLGSAVTVLSTDDPIRVFQRFSTLNAISNGRAEVILGRGSFTESYPLFGYDLAQYNELFEDKLARFAKLLEGDPVVYPPIERGRLRTWVGVGGSPESVVRAARHGLPLTLAIIGGSAKRFLPYVELYKRSLKELGKNELPIAVHSPGHIADSDQQAKDELFPHYMSMMNRIGRERGWPPRGRDDFEREAGPDGALYVGSPETVAAKIARTVTDLGLSRFDLKYSNGTLPHDKAMKSIELFGTKVVVLVREALAVSPQRRHDATIFG